MTKRALAATMRYWVAGFVLSTLVAGEASAGATYVYTTLDFPGAVITTPTGPKVDTVSFGINDAGIITGTYGKYGTYNEAHGFYIAGGAYHGFDAPNRYHSGPSAFDTWAGAVNNHNTAVGFSAQYNPANPVPQSLEAYSATISHLTPLDLPFASGTPHWNTVVTAAGINDNGDIVGSYGGVEIPDPSAASGYDFVVGTHGFLAPASGTPVSIDVPGAAETELYGINNSGIMVGFSSPTQGVSLRSITGAKGFYGTGLGDFKAINITGATNTAAVGINNTGDIVGLYNDAIGSAHGFLFDGISYQTIDVPGATGTQATGINDLGQIVGAYDGTTGTHGFLATPVLLPVGASPGAFEFDFSVAAGSTYFIDPQVAVGYDYLIGAGDPNFADATPPFGVDGGKFELWVCDGHHDCTDTGIEIAGGTTFDFLTNGWADGVPEFELLGIDPSAGLDPNDPNAFVTGLEFVSAGRFTGTMTAITEDVPEPAAIGLVIYALLGIPLVRRRRISY